MPAPRSVLPAPTAAALGPLEARVLEHLWERSEPAAVREVHGAFPSLAYTTLMTTLDRLYRKGLLLRRRRGRAFCYEPRRSRDELARELISGQVAALMRGAGASSAVLSTLVATIGREGGALLDELEALARAERARLKAKEE